MNGLRFTWSAFDKLSVRELHDILKLRADVFVVEQACCFHEIDGRDPEAFHLRAHHGDVDALAGTLRVFGPDREGAPAVIGRVVTAVWARGQNLGRGMMRTAVSRTRERFGLVPIEIGAQTRLEAFYQGLGFVRVGDDYDEDGIAHCRMVLEAPVVTSPPGTPRTPSRRSRTPSRRPG